MLLHHHCLEHLLLLTLASHFRLKSVDQVIQRVHLGYEVPVRGVIVPLARLGSNALNDIGLRIETIKWIITACFEGFSHLRLASV